jgi:predicted ATP-dependent serine protease
VSDLFRGLSEVIPGFDALIGGPLQLVNKLENDRRSALLHLRGSYGAGKTLLAAGLALGAAVQLEGTVAYLLTEELPTELRAQLRHVGLDAGLLHASIIEENIVAHPSEIPALVDTLRKSHKVSVLVIDAIDGTRWSHLNREAADGLAKFTAEDGLLTIVTEEADVAASPRSPWGHVADVSLDLVHTEDGHAVRCWKNRFGGACSRQMGLIIGPRGVRIRQERAR